MNYSLKKPKYSYEKEFDRIREEYNLEGQIKTVSNIACEYIITSDKEFFERIGEKWNKKIFWSSISICLWIQGFRRTIYFICKSAYGWAKFTYALNFFASCSYKR